MTTATPTKLRDGTWGARVAGAVAAGDEITITTRGGKSWTARVERVIWSGEGVTICATASLDRASGSSSRPSGGRGTWTGCSCGSVEEYARPRDCWTCRHDRD